ncbi:MAG: hypothetical protein DWQ31_11295 [Planctomycetota bacterium]|nr:MAG: hypothetical protein DWQ31_11295 [Planctomycetota bacterium]REJ98529.1 MAG: hypothetical protein DWQ35_00570 [Planctomycetota bacterium]REK29829.1 MAG: hypothetical protein DWQ42_02690 [Planctomycetota bacterium]REK48000.1 MAG: hypothetical protein DWQ46_03665 [Planctomycetota bacterium]
MAAIINQQRELHADPMGRCSIVADLVELSIRRLLGLAALRYLGGWRERLTHESRLATKPGTGSLVPTTVSLGGNSGQMTAGMPRDFRASIPFSR